MSPQTPYTLSVFGWYIYNMAPQDIFNTHKPPMKFKSSVSISSIDNLDTTVFNDPDNSIRLLTKVFFKPKDAHQLLHKDSFHPKHIFKGLIKSQILRPFVKQGKFIITIITEEANPVINSNSLSISF